MAKAKCLKCDGEAECFCKKGGGDGQFDEFFLICSKCGYQKSVKKRIGSPDALFGSFSDEYPNCPFCGQICNKHKIPPEINK